MTSALEQKIKQMPGPVLVLGASGFVGANLFRTILGVRADVYGTSSKPAAWRLAGLPEGNVLAADLLVERNLTSMIDRVRPRTVLDCVAYGAYPFEVESGLIFRTNVDYVVRLVEALGRAGTMRYIHAGSSSEYGDNSAGPDEESFLRPNSAYAASKAAAAQFLYYMGRKHGFPCANLRLYSVYGPWEDASRLMPNLVLKGLQGTYPPFVDPTVSRDFVYVDDACEAFIDAAVNLGPAHYGDSFNIGSGQKTTVAELADVARVVFGLKEAPVFGSMEQRTWDLSDWYADARKAERVLGWRVRQDLGGGLGRMAAWLRGLGNVEKYQQASKQFRKDKVFSVSAIVACESEEARIDDVCERVQAVLEQLNVDHEIILVNDAASDAVEESIRTLSARYREVLGLTHSRPFGSQAAFRSGMEVATKNACVLLSADSEDPPEVVADLVRRWKEGYEVVYGRPSQAGVSLAVRAAHRLFYGAFDRFSYIRLPHEAGDFSLMDRRVVKSLLCFPERDLFIRGVRAFAGFKQTGVDYEPSRRVGFFRRLHHNIGRAKRGILAFSTAPLSLLSVAGVVLFALSVLLVVSQLILKLLVPASTPQGLTTVLVAITFFGSINLLGLSILGEYLATVFEEVKHRPHAILRHVVRDGEIRAASENVAGFGGGDGAAG